MAKPITSLILILLLLSCSFFIATYARTLNLSPKKQPWSIRNLNKGGTEKSVELHFYVQDELGGLTPTVYEVARASISSNSPTTFGQVRVLDDLLTAEPDRNSEEVGRAQGLITSADLETTALAMNLNFYFTCGEYNGSTISILGRNPLAEAEREVAVVGGTGVFRFARGYAVTSLYSYDVEEEYGVLEYTLYVRYLDDSDDSSVPLKADV